jgi:competence protein ComEA
MRSGHPMGQEQCKEAVMSIIRTLGVTFLFLLAVGLSAQDLVNINTADAATLAEAIKGVGIKRAEAIVAYRSEHGPFKSVDELTSVQGIGEKILEESRERLTVGTDGG